MVDLSLIRENFYGTDQADEWQCVDHIISTAPLQENYYPMVTKLTTNIKSNNAGGLVKSLRNKLKETMANKITETITTYLFTAVLSPPSSIIARTVTGELTSWVLAYIIRYNLLGRFL